MQVLYCHFSEVALESKHFDTVSRARILVQGFVPKQATLICARAAVAPMTPHTSLVPDSALEVSFTNFAANRLSPDQMEWLYLEQRETLERWMEQRREAVEAKASLIVEATLTDAWRRLIGPAWRLVAALMRLRLEAELETGAGTTGHVFASQDALAARVGVTARTLRSWLSADHPGAPYLRCWLAHRTWYITRNDGFRSRGGTLWRVGLEPRGTQDLTPAPAVSYDALRTPWRSADELPAARASSDAEAVLDNSGHEKAGEEYVPKKLERLEVRVEGRHLQLCATTSRSDFHSGNSLPNPTRVQFAQAWAKAESVAAKLGDAHSTGFWFAQFRRLEVAGCGDGAIWSAVGQGLEARAAGRLTRATAAGYAVGILRRTAAGSARA